MRWLAFGTFDVERHPRVAVLIEGLRASGDEVVEVNAPLRLSTAERVAMVRQPWRLPLLAWRLGTCWLRLTMAARREVRRRAPDAVLVGYLGHFDVRLARLLFRRTPIALDHLVSAAGTAEDRALAGRGGIKHRVMRWIDRTALRRADVVVVDTAAQGATLPAEAAGRAVVVPVGAASVWFRAGEARGETAVAPRQAGAGEARREEAGEVAVAPRQVGAGEARREEVGEVAVAPRQVGAGEARDEQAMAARRLRAGEMGSETAHQLRVGEMGSETAHRLRAGETGGGTARREEPRGDRAGEAARERSRAPVRVIFVGLFTPLHGTATIGEALAKLAGDERFAFTMVGTGQDYDRCRRLAAANPRVTWLDWVPGADLPELVARHDVSLGIFGTTDKATRVVPTKVYQGLAAGCVVVTSDTGPQRDALGGAAVLVPPGDAAALVEALRSLADDRDRLAELKSSGRMHAAARFGPDAVVEPLRRSVARLEFGHRRR